MREKTLLIWAHGPIGSVCARTPHEYRTTKDAKRPLILHGQRAAIIQDTARDMAMSFFRLAGQIGLGAHTPPHTTCKRSLRRGPPRPPPEPHRFWALTTRLRRATACTNTHASRRADTTRLPTRLVHQKTLLRRAVGRSAQSSRYSRPPQAWRACVVARGKRGGKVGCEACLSRRRSCVLMSAARS